MCQAYLYYISVTNKNSSAGLNAIDSFSQEEKLNFLYLRIGKFQISDQDRAYFL